MEKIIYCKYANERSNRFALRTDIVQQGNGDFVVQKKALEPEAKAHVENIHTVGEALNDQYANSRFTFNKCAKTDDGIELEYIEGETLAEQADKLIYSGKTEEARKMILEVIDEIYKVEEKQKFHQTAEFEEVFGKTILAQDKDGKEGVDELLMCAPVSDIDMLLDNIIQGEKWTVIDYEWSFTFPIPLKFIVYRLLHYYLHSNQARSVLDEKQMFEAANISENELANFWNMERHFQDIYVLTNTDGSHHTPLRDMYATITDGCVNIRALYEMASGMAVTDEEKNDLILALANRAKLYGENVKLKDELAQKEAKISIMEDTKVWKAYRKYRDLKENNRSAGKQARTK